MFQWTDDCEKAMATLKERPTSSPVLAYPSFDKPFVVETDASIAGIGRFYPSPRRMASYTQ